MRWLIILVLGSGLGLLAALGDAAQGVLRPTLASQALTIATHLGTTYAAAAVLAGWLLARRSLTLLGGPAVLTAAVVAYTGYVDLFVDHHRLTVASLSRVVGIYLLAALTIGPFLAMVGQIARDGSLLGTIARISIPVALVAEVTLRFPLHRTTYTLDPNRAWTLTAIIGVGVLGFVLGTIGRRPTGHH